MRRLRPGQLIGLGRGVRGRVVVAEVTGAAMIGSVFAPRWVLAGVSILGAAVLVATFGRAGGRWWWEAVTLSRRFRRRRRLAAAQVVTAAVDGGPVPLAVAWLRTLAPGLTLRPVTVGIQTVAVGADMDGWFAAVEVGSLWGEDAPLAASEPDAGPSSPWAAEAVTVRLRAGPPPVPYRELAELLAHVSTVQVVLAPGPTLDQPRTAWVAVRILPSDALATERAGGVSAIERTVAAAAAKAVRTLETAGWAARLVPPDGLVPALAEATGLDGPPQEYWSWWRAGRTVRTHYAVQGWAPAHGTVATGFTQLSVHLQHTGTGEPLERAAVVGAVTAAPAALRWTCHEVVSAAAAQALRLRRLDGEQAIATWATAPTAAPVPGPGAVVQG
jgi:hypothetical protein